MIYLCDNCGSQSEEPEQTGGYIGHDGALDHSGPDVCPECGSADIEQGEAE